MSEWMAETGVTCVVCPKCGFAFDASHTNDTPLGGYTCPLCDCLVMEELLRQVLATPIPFSGTRAASGPYDAHRIPRSLKDAIRKAVK